jgi:putative ABC transport system permease protein
MSTLDRKLRRDLRRIRGQASAIAAVIAAGLAVSVLGLCNLQTLSRSRDDMYERYHFADIFVSMKRAPLEAARQLAEIPGVATVVPRVLGTAMLDMPDVAEPVAVRLVGVPAHARPALNDLAIREGGYLGGPGEAVVSEAFASAHALAPGDTIVAVMNTARQRLRVVGIATSPEFIYAVRPGTMFPDDRRYGVLWLDERSVAAAFELNGAFNDAVLKLEPAASERHVIDAVDRIAGRYGGTGAYARGDQASHWFLDGELSELRTTGRILPTVFSAVAAFLLHIVISRLVAMQREQIGVLRAFGYSSAALSIHYAKLVLLITAAGAVLGVPAGLWLGWALSGLYQRFFHFPALFFTIPVGGVAGAVLVAASVAVAGSLFALRAVARIAPAVALRPPAPASFRATLLDRAGVHAHVRPWARMVLRNLGRRPLRAAVAVVAVALAVAIMILGRFGDALEFVMDVEFSQAQRQSGTLTFTDAHGMDAFREVLRYPGVLAGEPFRVVPVRFVQGHVSKRGAITGLVAQPELARPLDTSRGSISPPAEGLVVSDKLARLLGIVPGDRVTVEVLEGRRTIRETTLMATVEDYLGTAAYMELSALNRLMREGQVVSGAQLLFDRADEPAVFARVKNTPGVAGLTVMHAVRTEFERTLAQSLLLSMTFLVGIAGIIAFGVVFNTARITLSERAWDLATLRVLGFTRREIGAILLGEVGTIVALALPAGTIVGYLLARMVSAAYDTEMYRLPPAIAPGSYVFAVSVVTGAAALCGAVIWRMAGRLDLVAVLKARE